MICLHILFSYSQCMSCAGVTFCMSVALCFLIWFCIFVCVCFLNVCIGWARVCARLLLLSSAARPCFATQGNASCLMLPSYCPVFMFVLRVILSLLVCVCVSRCLVYEPDWHFALRGIAEQTDSPEIIHCMIFSYVHLCAFDVLFSVSLPLLCMSFFVYSCWAILRLTQIG